MSVPEPIVNPPVTPTPAPEPDNATIRSMRAELAESAKVAKEASEKAAALENELKQIERAKMDELTRLQAEKADLEAKVKEGETLRDEHGKFASTFEKLFTETLATVPEDKRADVEALASQGTWADRFQALNSAIKLLGPSVVSVPRVQPTTPSTVTDPPVIPPNKTNAEVAKEGGMRGVSLETLTNTEIRRKPAQRAG